uniref:Uncharacterized protein n=1 Tax=Physcomitrium patens TaxID=3218 RepID=A0A2K1JPT6_PHYPA|nr:hypothetical protein PHYPA_015929 [Physcomitrium patens]
MQKLACYAQGPLGDMGQCNESAVSARVCSTNEQTPVTVDMEAVACSTWLVSTVIDFIIGYLCESPSWGSVKVMMWVEQDTEGPLKIIFEGIVICFFYFTAHSVSGILQMQATLELATCVPTAIISGRARPKVCKFVKLSELYHARSHGMDNGSSKELKWFQGRLVSTSRQEICTSLVETTKSTKGVSVKNNKYCGTVHFPNVKEEVLHYV